MKKLIRDKYIDIIPKEKLSFGDIEDRDSYKKYLCGKLVEESLELQATDNIDDFIEELGDVLEVLELMVNRRDIAHKVYELKEKKREKFGGFKTFLLLDL